MGYALYQRSISVTVGITIFTGLRMAFSVSRTLKAEPNTAELTIYNLSKDQRTSFQATAQDVTISAGYEGGSGLLFSGQLQICTNTAQGPDWVTTLRSADGATGYRSARLNESMAPGMTIAEAIKRVARSMGVGIGDAEARITTGRFRQGLTQYLNGLVLSGYSRDLLTGLLRAQGIEWSIQNNVLQLLPRKQPTNEPAILLTSGSGLIGSPEVGEGGIVRCTALLQHGFTPGRSFVLQTDLIPNGLFRVEKVTHSGDTHGDQWYSEIQGNPL